MDALMYKEFLQVSALVLSDGTFLIGTFLKRMVEIPPEQKFITVFYPRMVIHGCIQSLYNTVDLKKIEININQISILIPLSSIEPELLQRYYTYIEENDSTSLKKENT